MDYWDNNLGIPHKTQLFAQDGPFCSFGSTHNFVFAQNYIIKGKSKGTVPFDFLILHLSADIDPVDGFCIFEKLVAG